MIFSIRRTTRALLAPDHRLSCSLARWRDILAELARRGEGRHEAGAFLLGVVEGRRRRITEAIYYDELDSKAYQTGVCVLEGGAFGPLWRMCREKALTVVADVHTHGGDACQSESDRTNPMIARAGHIALIVPNLAKGSIQLGALGVYEYQGAHTWTSHSGSRARRYFYQGFWS
jgi:hypothetical protein